ncbi:MAG TPA: hypothetical protein VN523_12475 [Hyphomicrobiaceae bacterium]|jgi:hypothetical protein|nr:hypothetical protein [Hyphomicrobiaceae bacterium]
MTDPVPLTPSELARIWRWQRRMFVFYGIAIALLALAGALMLMFGELAWVRRAAVAWLFVLLAAAAMVQFRERCPRCGLRLGSHGRLFLPEQCRGCGVVFERPPPS